MKYIVLMLSLLIASIDVRAMEKVDAAAQGKPDVEQVLESLSETDRWTQPLLLASSEGINFQDADRRTPLMHALHLWSKFQSDCIEFSQTCYTKAAARLALQNLLHYLEASIKQDPLFLRFLAILNQQRSAFEKLLRTLLETPGLDLAIQDTAGSYAFDAAVQLNDPLALRLFFEYKNIKGASVVFDSRVSLLRLRLLYGRPHSIRFLAGLAKNKNFGESCWAVHAARQYDNSIFILKMLSLYFIKQQGLPIDTEYEGYSPLKATFFSPYADNGTGFTQSNPALARVLQTPGTEAELAELEDLFLVLGAQWPEDDDITISRKRTEALVNFVRSGTALDYCTLFSKMGSAVFTKAAEENFNSEAFNTFITENGLRDKCLRDLQEKKAVINMRDARGRTALLWTAARGQTELGRRLLEFDTLDVNAVDIFLCTALHYAVLNDHVPMIAELLADPWIDRYKEDISGASAYDIAQFHQNERVLAMFKMVFRELGIRRRTLVESLARHGILPWEICMLIAKMLRW